MPPVPVEVHASVAVWSRPCCCPRTAFTVVPSETFLSLQVASVDVPFYILNGFYVFWSVVEVAAPSVFSWPPVVSVSSGESTFMASSVVAAVKSVSHAVASVYTSVVKRAPFIPAASSVMVPAVASAI